MSTEMGMLLAQMIPVLALALGLELRSYALKPKAELADNSQDVFDTLATWFGVVVAVILTAGEQTAIAAAARNPGWSPLSLDKPLIPESPLLGLALQFCVYAVFLLPAAQALTARLPRMSSAIGHAGGFFVVFLVLVTVSLLLPLVL
jgi:hypothetical protein